jgi:hypothetical protein
MLGVIFRKAQNKIQDPAKLRRLIVELIDREKWTSLAAVLTLWNAPGGAALMCSGGSAAAASLPRREQRKAGRRRSPSSPARYNGITSVKEQRADRSGRSDAHGKSPTRQARVTRIGRELGPGPNFCPPLPFFRQLPYSVFRGHGRAERPKSCSGGQSGRLFFVTCARPGLLERRRGAKSGAGIWAFRFLERAIRSAERASRSVERAAVARSRWPVPGNRWCVPRNRRSAPPRRAVFFGTARPFRGTEAP